MVAFQVRRSLAEPCTRTRGSPTPSSTHSRAWSLTIRFTNTSLRRPPGITRRLSSRSRVVRRKPQTRRPALVPPRRWADNARWSAIPRIRQPSARETVMHRPATSLVLSLLTVALLAGAAIGAPAPVPVTPWLTTPAVTMPLAVLDDSTDVKPVALALDAPPLDVKELWAAVGDAAVLAPGGAVAFETRRCADLRAPARCGRRRGQPGLRRHLPGQPGLAEGQAAGDRPRALPPVRGRREGVRAPGAGQGRQRHGQRRRDPGPGLAHGWCW